MKVFGNRVGGDEGVVGLLEGREVWLVAVWVERQSWEGDGCEGGWVESA